MHGLAALFDDLLNKAALLLTLHLIIRWSWSSNEALPPRCRRVDAQVTFEHDLCRVGRAVISGMIAPGRLASARRNRARSRHLPPQQATDGGQGRQRLGGQSAARDDRPSAESLHAGPLRLRRARAGSGTQHGRAREQRQLVGLTRGTGQPQPLGWRDRLCCQGRNLL